MCRVCFFGFGETFTNIYAYANEPKDVDETQHVFLSARLIYFLKICLDDNSKTLFGCIIYYYSWANIQNERLSIKVFEYIRHSGSQRIIFGLPRNQIAGIKRRIENLLVFLLVKIEFPNLNIGQPTQ